MEDLEKQKARDRLFDSLPPNTTDYTPDYTPEEWKNSLKKIRTGTYYSDDLATA